MSQTVDVTPEASATTPDTSNMAAALDTSVRKTEVSIRSLIEAGAHFGHQTRRWDPRMRPFIFGERNGIHILNLDQTLPRFLEALAFLKDVTASGGKVLFVGTKRQIQPCVQFDASRARQYYVNNRWLGGMLTNFRTVKKSIDHYKELEATLANPEKVAGLSKQEIARINREIQRYEKSLGGIKNMESLPDAIFVIDVSKEHLAIAEASRLGIPIVAIVDSNCNPDGIDFMIPANDDAIRAVQLYCAAVADACLDGDAVYQTKLQSDPTVRQRKEESKTAKSGRRVVDIKQAAGAGGKGRGKRQAGGTASAGGARGGRKWDDPEDETIVAGEEEAGPAGTAE